MKSSNLLLSLLVLGLTAPVFAEQKEGHATVTVTLPSSQSEGWRVSFIKALDIEADVDVTDYGSDNGNEANHKFGFGVSKVSVVPHNFGYLFTGAYNEMRFKGATSKVAALRAEANATYGFENVAYIFGGLNLAKYVKNDLKKLDFGFGWQLGVGAQFNPQFGTTLALIKTNNDGRINGYSLDVEMQAIELGLNFTF